jgi:ketosteroid isomerase-like protein
MSKRTSVDKHFGFTGAIAGLVSMSLALVSCVSESGPSAVDVVTARVSIDSLWTHFAEAADRHDAEAFGALLTDDASVVYSNALTTHGRAATQAFLASRHAGADVTALRVIPDDFKMSDFLATQTGTLEEDYTQDGAATTEVNRFLLVAQRVENGTWRIWRLVAVVDTTAG